MTTVQTIELIIREIAEVGVDDEDFSTSIDLFDYGYLDSFGIVNLIAAIQESFGVDMMNIDFYGEDIRTIEAISATIMKQNT
ncbi:MAG: acyl carrier protein [Rhodospirillaceae bacterium]|jgi:acyl carrier protein|nr:acyl carrier protein [Rhodospirillaceae bacterium]|tara:strand:+ start:768 stop:1013 length:246 start_codon:yes stop_codon:yes gene_type:complete